MNNGFNVEFLGSQKGEALVEVKTHLVTKDTDGAGTRAIIFLNAQIENVTEEILISLQNPVIWRAKVKSYMRNFNKAWADELKVKI